MNRPLEAAQDDRQAFCPRPWPWPRSPAGRRHLERLRRRDRDDPVFRDIADAGYGFTRDLAALFETTFDEDHPIRRTILF